VATTSTLTANNKAGVLPSRLPQQARRRLFSA
jgi:hypothetical protein